MLFWRNRHDVSDEELSAFVDGELEESSRGRVERHMESCTSCSETVTELRAVSRAMSELPSVRAPRSFALREADVTDESVSEGAGLFASATPLLSGVAAIAIVAFVVLVGVDMTGNGRVDFDNTTSGGMSQQLEGRASVAPEVEDVTDQEGDRYGNSFAAYDTGEEEPAPDGAISDDPDAFGNDEVLSDNLESTTDDDADGPGASPRALLPDEITEDPQLSWRVEESGQASTAPALADDDGDDTGLRVAESVAAAVAIAAGGSVLLIWWRRRATAV